MCGGCPGGSVVSPLTAYVNLRGIKAQVVQELNSRCLPYYRIRVSVDTWLVSSVAGQQKVFHAVESVLEYLELRLKHPVVLESLSNWESHQQ